MLGIGADDYGLGTRPPLWLPNSGSRQTVGLVAWYSPHNSLMVDMFRNAIALPRQLNGTRAVEVFAGAPGGGICGRSEGSASHVRVAGFDTGSPGLLNGLTSVTVAYWIYVVNFDDNGGWWGQGDTTGNNTFLEYSVGGGTTGPRWSGGSDLRNAFTTKEVVGQFQHIAWTADASDTRYYRNGILQQTVAGGCGTIASATDYGLIFGCVPVGTGAGIYGVNALWADFRVYNRRLDDADIWALYAPPTRWELYDTSVDYVWSDPVSAPPAGAVGPLVGSRLVHAGILQRRLAA